MRSVALFLTGFPLASAPRDRDVLRVPKVSWSSGEGKAYLWGRGRVAEGKTSPRETDSWKPITALG